MEPPFPAVVGRRPGARGGRAARRRAPGADRHRATGAAVGASSRAPTCWRRWLRERVRRRRDAIATRAVHAGLEPDPAFGSVIPAIHQTSTYVQPAPGEFVERLRLLALGQPDPQPRSSGARRARGRARASRSPPGMAAEHALITARVPAGDAHRAARTTSTAAPTGSSTRCSAAGASSYDLVDQTDLDAVARGGARRHPR